MTTQAQLCRSGCHEVNLFAPMAYTDSEARPVTVKLCPLHAAAPELGKALWTLPYRAYFSALRDGADANGAYDALVEDQARHVWAAIHAAGMPYP